MADKHPYVPTQSYLVQVISHFRSSFPQTITADTLRKLGFAPKNESYILNILRFLQLIDDEGNKTDPASKIFSITDDSAFSEEFAKLVWESYSDLFDLHGDNAWSLNTNGLITFFRSSDETTATVGKLQASAFKILASFSGYGEMPEPRTKTAKSSTTSTKKKAATPKTLKTEKPISSHPNQTSLKRKFDDVGLTVRIEINLPADGDQETYDRIFKSIREHLLNG